MTNEVASEKLSWSANLMTWLYAYGMYRKTHGRKLATRMELAFTALFVLTLLIVHFFGPSIKELFNNALLMTGWLIWSGVFLIERYEVNKIRRRASGLRM